MDAATPAPAPAATGPTPPAARRGIRPRRVVFGVLVGILVVLCLVVVRMVTEPFFQGFRTTPVYDPPVLAGQRVAYWCSGGVYARTADGRIVITTAGHCGSEGDQVTTPDEGLVVGLLSAPSGYPCDPAHQGVARCTTSDMAYVPLVPSMIPWGHLDLIDMGAGGYRTIAPGTTALSCDQIAIGDKVEINGRKLFRSGRVVGKAPYDHADDSTYFPCILGADVRVNSGDSGGIVLVNGLPAGVSARMFMVPGGPYLGFTPLAQGLAELGLTMCDSPSCGLSPPAGATVAP